MLQNAEVSSSTTSLSPPEILERSRRDAERVLVGKRKGEPGIGQYEINRRLVPAATAGKQVVRLKSGDPFRGSGAAARSLNISGTPSLRAFVVPASPSAHVCAAEAGLPLTFRKKGDAVELRHRQNRGRRAGPSTGRACPIPPHRRGSTWAFSSAALGARRIDQGLPRIRRPPRRPRPRHATRRQDGRRALDELPALAARAGEGPALLVIGDVVAHSDPWRAADFEQAGVAA